MNKKIYLVIVPLIITACSGSKENKEKSGTASHSVNSAIVNVSEVVGVGKVEPEKEIISLAASTGGVVKEIYRNDGDTIKKDEPLVRLDDELELIRVSQLRSEYNTQKSQEDIDELNLRESEARLANKKKLLESLRVLAADQVRYAEAEASKKTLRSPYDGLMLEMLIEKGSSVNQFEKYAEVAPSGPMTVRTEVDELFAGRLRLGLDADIRYIGSDSVIAKGKVVFLSPYLKKKSLFSQKANEQEDRLVREVRIKLEGDNGLILNSKVESVIKLKSNKL
jgi:multidrug resistance efflux pump